MIHTLMLYNRSKGNECGINLTIDLDPCALSGQLFVDCITGWEGVYSRIYYGVYVWDSPAPSSTGYSYLSALNPRHAQYPFVVYVPQQGMTPTCPVPTFASYQAAFYGNGVPARGCTCDIKQLMGTGHSRDCVDHPNNKLAGAGAGA